VTSICLDQLQSTLTTILKSTDELRQVAYLFRVGINKYKKALGIF